MHPRDLDRMVGAAVLHPRNNDVRTCYVDHIDHLLVGRSDGEEVIR